MNIKDTPEGKLIVLSQAFDTRPKLLNLLYFTVFFISGLFFLKDFNLDTNNITGTIIIAIVIVILMVCSFRFANSSISSERVIISDKRIILIKKGLLSTQQQEFDRSQIVNFRHLGRAKITNHPLNGQSLDYLGFQTQDKLISEMHGENRLAFDYRENTIAFGNNIYSWDFEAIEDILSDSN